MSNYTWASKSRTFFEDFSQRIDQQFSSDFKLYGSYTYNHQSGLGRPTSVAIPAFDGANGILTPFTQRNLSIGATKLFGPTMLNDIRIGYYRSRNDTFVPSYNQNWAQTLGIPNDSPLLMPSFSSVAASGTGAAPALNTMYGLTVPGPSRTVRETLSFRDDFSKIVGTHAFKAGYEILHFRGNYFQLGQPSGVFQFDNMTAGLQPNGQPVPNTGNLLAGFELGSVRAANFTTYTTTWLPRDSVHSLYLQDDWKVSKNVDAESGSALVYRESFPHGARTVEQFQPDRRGSGDRQDGRHHPSDRRLKSAQPAEFPTAHRYGLASAGAVGVPRRLRHQHVDIRFPNALQQFDEYQAQVVQARAPGDPRPLFQLSQGPAPVVYNILAQQHGHLCRHQLWLAQPLLDGRQSASRLRGELERHRGVPVRRQ